MLRPYFGGTRRQTEILWFVDKNWRKEDYLHVFLGNGVVILLLLQPPPTQ